jgi:hypothetical protein
VAHTVAQPVFAPEYSVSAERENEVLVANAPESPEGDLADALAHQVLVGVPAPAFALVLDLRAGGHFQRLTSAATSAGASRVENCSQPGQPGQ